VHRILNIAAAALTATLLGAPAALADEHTVSSGQVAATLSYDQLDDYEFSDLWLTVARAGVPVYDEPVDITNCDEPYCIPTVAVSNDDNGLTVRDLDADGEPEVIMDVFTGGAHCCTVSETLRWDGTGYRAAEHNWFDAGYRLRDFDGDGRPEFKTADTRFAYKWASFAFSGFPVRVLSYQAGHLTDITRAHKPLIRSDARYYKRVYRKALRKHWEPLGLIAAWTADQYQLHRRRAALRFLRYEARAGHLYNGPYYKSGRAYIRQLDETLRRWGY
jgi:hypothetical protein